MAELIKKYSPSSAGPGLEDWLFTHDDIEIFMQKNRRISEGMALRLFDYMKSNGKTIRTSECFDSGSGWRGNNIWVGDVDLSVNGYCFRDSEVEKFLKSVGHC